MNKGVAAVVVGVLAVSTAAVMFKAAAAPALAAGFWRLALATLVLGVVGARQVAAAVRDPAILRLQALTGLALAVHFGAWIESLYRTSVAASLVLVTLHPVLVALAGAFVLGERPNRGGLAGVLVSLVGVAVIAAGGDRSGTALSGNALALLGAVAMVPYILAGRHARRRVPTLGWVVPVYGFAALFLGIAALVAGDPLTGYSPKQWFLFAALAAVPMILGHTMFNVALAHLPAYVIATSILAEPPGGTLLAYLVLDEVPGVAEVLGGLVALAGVYIVLRKSKAAASAEATAIPQGSG